MKSGSATGWVNPFSTGNPAVDAAVDRLLDLPDDVKPMDAADRIADLLEAIGTPDAVAMAKRMRDARCDGDRLLALFDELEKLNADEAAQAVVRGGVA